MLGYKQSDEVFSMVNSSDIFLMPSRYEGTPIALLEAAALGKAIVASNVGGIPEVIEDGKDGLLVPPGDTEALIDKIIYALNNPDKMRSMAEIAKEKVKKDFSIDKMIKALEAYYEKLSEGN